MKTPDHKRNDNFIEISGTAMPKPHREGFDVALSVRMDYDTLIRVIASAVVAELRRNPVK